MRWPARRRVDADRCSERVQAAPHAHALDLGVPGRSVLLLAAVARFASSRCRRGAGTLSRPDGRAGDRRPGAVPCEVSAHCRSNHRGRRWRAACFGLDSQTFPEAIRTVVGYPQMWWGRIGSVSHHWPFTPHGSRPHRPTSHTRCGLREWFGLPSLNGQKSAAIRTAEPTEGSLDRGGARRDARQGSQGFARPWATAGPRRD